MKEAAEVFSNVDTADCIKRTAEHVLTSLTICFMRGRLEAFHCFCLWSLLWDIILAETDSIQPD